MASSAIMAMLDTLSAEDNPRNAKYREPVNARGFSRGIAADERKRINENAAAAMSYPMTPSKWTSLKSDGATFRVPNFQQTTAPMRNEVYTITGQPNQKYSDEVIWGPRCEEWWWNSCLPGEMKPRSGELEKEIEQFEEERKARAGDCNGKYETKPRMSILRRVRTYASIAPSAAASAYGSIRTNMSSERRNEPAGKLNESDQAKSTKRQRGANFRTLTRLYYKYRVAPRRLPKDSEVLTTGQKFHQRYLMKYHSEHEGFKVRGGFSV